MRIQVFFFISIFNILSGQGRDSLTTLDLYKISLENYLSSNVRSNNKDSNIYVIRNDWCNFTLQSYRNSKIIFIDPTSIGKIASKKISKYIINIFPVKFHNSKIIIRVVEYSLIRKNRNLNLASISHIEYEYEYNCNNRDYIWNISSEH